MSTNKKHFRSGLILTAENIISGGIKFLFSVLIVKKFGSLAQGEFSYITTIASYFTILSIAIVDQSNLVSVPKIKDKLPQLSKYFGTAIITSLFFIAIGLAIFIGMVNLNLIKKIPLPLLLVSVYICLVSFRQVIRSILLGTEKYFLQSAVNVSVEAILLSLLFFTNSLNHFFQLSIFVLCLPTLIFIITISKKLKWSISYSWVQAKSIITYGSKMFLYVVLQTILFRVDVFFIMYMYNAKILSYYMICTVMAELIIIPSKSITVIVLNKTINHEASLTNQSFRILSTLILFIGVGITIAGSIFIPIIYGSKYGEQINVFWMQCLGSVIVANIYIYSYYLLGKGNNKIILVANLISIIPGLFLYYFLSKYFGIIGTSIASTTSYAIIFLVLVVWMKKNIPLFHNLSFLVPTIQTISFLKTKLNLKH